MSSLLSYVWLSLKRGLGNYLRAEVLRRMGFAEAVYAADSTMLAQSCPSLRRQHIELLCDKSTDEAAQVITQCAREDIRTCPFRTPPTRTACGRSRTRRSCCISAAGGRISTPCRASRSSARGRRRATACRSPGRSARSWRRPALSRSAAWRSATTRRRIAAPLRAGGLTVAVLAGGPDVCYPPQNRALMGDILLSGAVISEYPPGTEPGRPQLQEPQPHHQRPVRRDGHRRGRKRALGRAHHRTSRARSEPRRLCGPRCNGRAAVQRVQRPHRAVRGRPAERPEGARARVCEPAARRRGRISCLYPPAVARTAPKQRTASQRRTPAKPAPVPETAAPTPEKPAFTMPEGLDENEQKIVRLVGEGMHSLEELVECCGLPAPRLMCMVTTLEMEGVLERDAANVRLAGQE